MVEKIKIKKELTEEEFKEILTAFQESIKKKMNIDDLGTFFQELVKKITPAKEVHLMIVSAPGKTVETVTLEKNITIDVSSSKSILATCFQTKEALFSNDVVRDTHYNKEIDNFLDYPLKNLLLVPLLNDDKEILGLIWAAIPQKDWNQYMQSDIGYMVQFSVLNEKMILEEKKIKEKKEIKEEKSPVEEPHEEANQNHSSSIMKRVKSWIFK